MNPEKNKSSPPPHMSDPGLRQGAVHGFLGKLHHLFLVVQHLNTLLPNHFGSLQLFWCLGVIGLGLNLLTDFIQPTSAADA